MADSTPARDARMVGLLEAAHEAMAAAVDGHLSPALAAVNAERQFDCRAQADALRRWLAGARESDGTLDQIEFLEELLRVHTGEVAVSVVLAEAYRSAGHRELATARIGAAVAAHRYDLHVGTVARSIYRWAEGKENDDVDDWLRGRHCDMPFTNLDAMPSGDAFVCCGDWLPVPIGNVNRQSAAEIWNSPVARELRASIADGSFRYCSRLSCMAIINRELPPRPMIGPPVEPVPPPTRLVLSHDNSCNLSCPSCRAHVIMSRKPEQDRLNALLDSVFVPLLRCARTARISGSGDPFASHHYRTLLRRINREEFPELYVDLHTNAQLFDERAWTELELSGKVGQVEISIDAATAETYAVVRRGGDFERLLANLTFIASLRRRLEFSRLVFSFVVQQANFREMPAFVELAERSAADEVDFRMILNWGSMSPESFATAYVGDPAHPEHREYLAILSSPTLRTPWVRLPAR